MQNDDKDPQGNGGGGNAWMKNMLVVFAIVGALFLFVSLFNNGMGDSRASQTIPYSEFLSKVDDGSVKEVTIADNVITGKYAGDQGFRTISPNDNELVDRLQRKSIKFSVKPEEQGSIWVALLLQALPFLLILGIAFFVMRQMQKNAGSGAMGFGKSRAKLLTEKHGRVTFDDVAGIEEAREELEEIVEFLKDPSRFARLGGKIPKGALLVGSPGTGKTLLARAIAGEAGVPFFTISGSDFVEMFVGVGASRVRDMFEQAKKNAPCIVFIDEIDAVGRHRGAGLGNGNDEREQTLNQLLVEMDGFEANEGIIIIAATNRPDVLDPALLRPGRFDRQVVVPRPDIEGRVKILEVHMKKVPTAPDVDTRTIARGTPGFSGADLANLVNEAALLAARKAKRLVAMLEFEEAKDKVYMGAARKSMVMTEEEKKSTAYHEAGHAIVSLVVPGCDPLHKVTIIPRGRALGVTWNLPERDVLTQTMKSMKGKLALCFGGRIAEQLIYGHDELNTGAANDIQQATNLARAMVMEYGMSEKLGWLRYRDNQDEVFLGHSVARAQNMSEETARLIDSEVRRLIEEAEATARKVLTDNLDSLHRVTEALLEFETLTGEETKRLMNGEDIGRDLAPRAPQLRPATGSSIPKSKRPGGGAWGNPAPQGA
ncbi:ATP-dependent metallopeptidase FtsH/Yme1/Tma family protein [Sphingomonas sp. CGMCC 1.13654]|uniref:ATP-dependent zinc metalloprotease FtsH n=1 Tax=Sphingomonas chungangi TaxID=2683589 RepID=A0A838L1E8_9SPHN|nr:ATP-dependent zinc metalloprotease FtsH [Sphingomonas chungangi]MBA2932760.1 ATP-dependent metallopeptidase FtsH/Yme1/Tma family protein [Sphingomonas chungangi]MVW56382.1 ATP-dependent zinc metalloprotease FtsH [Sphingomonas chungangi]